MCMHVCPLARAQQQLKVRTIRTPSLSCNWLKIKIKNLKVDVAIVLTITKSAFLDGLDGFYEHSLSRVL